MPAVAALRSEIARCVDLRTRPPSRLLTLQATPCVSRAETSARRLRPSREISHASSPPNGPMLRLETKARYANSKHGSARMVYMPPSATYVCTLESLHVGQWSGSTKTSVFESQMEECNDEERMKRIKRINHTSNVRVIIYFMHGKNDLAEMESGTKWGHIAAIKVVTVIKSSAALLKFSLSSKINFRFIWHNF